MSLAPCTARYSLPPRVGSVAILALLLALLVALGMAPRVRFAVSLSAGGHHNLLVKDDGSLWGWGRNDSAQLGDGTTVDRPYLVRTLGLTNVQQASAGLSHSVALRTDGTVWT